MDSAVSLGLAAIALTDHNTVDGLPEFLSAARGKNVEAIAGVEFSVDYEEEEFHLLGLFVEEVYFPEISRLMEEYAQRKAKSNQDLIHSLNQAGYALDYEAIKNATPNGKFNRAHVAAELTRKGYTASIKEAFRTLLSKTGGYYKEPKRPSIFEMIDFITKIGAVPVLAHPFLNAGEDKLCQLLPLAKQRGLVGMECYYPLYDRETTQKSLALADKFGLKYSGGSDFHGGNKPDIAMGVGKGNLQIPYAWANELKNKAE